MRTKDRLKRNQRKQKREKFVDQDNKNNNEDNTINNKVESKTIIPKKVVSNLKVVTTKVIINLVYNAT